MGERDGSDGKKNRAEREMGEEKWEGEYVSMGSRRSLSAMLAPMTLSMLFIELAPIRSALGAEEGDAASRAASRAAEKSFTSWYWTRSEPERRSSSYKRYKCHIYHHKGDDRDNGGGRGQGRGSQGDWNRIKQYGLQIALVVAPRGLLQVTVRGAVGEAQREREGGDDGAHWTESEGE